MVRRTVHTIHCLWNKMHQSHADYRFIDPRLPSPVTKFPFPFPALYFSTSCCSARRRYAEPCPSPSQVRQHIKP
jgi:hypothetical protein